MEYSAERLAKEINAIEDKNKRGKLKRLLDTNQDHTDNCLNLWERYKQRELLIGREPILENNRLINLGIKLGQIYKLTKSIEIDEPNKPKVSLLKQKPKTVGREWNFIRGRVLRRDNKQCLICHTDERLTIHHMKPRAHGGTDEMRNLLTLCNECHDFVELHGLSGWNAISKVRDLWREMHDYKKIGEIIAESNHRQKKVSS